ncbi:hypothetical protein BRD01_08440 [Halobacteriales archaeon QS_8_65_32]|nr:MAG: hypothetical protein BRD01_08440 [Halobacteriales archaeon QS_8_65_32]
MHRYHPAATAVADDEPSPGEPIERKGFTIQEGRRRVPHGQRSTTTARSDRRRDPPRRSAGRGGSGRGGRADRRPGGRARRRQGGHGIPPVRVDRRGGGRADGRRGGSRARHRVR